MKPIWKDIIVTLGTGASAEFYITQDGTEIYRGRAYKRPGAAAVTVRINDIIAQHLAFVPDAGIDTEDGSQAVALPIVSTFRTYLADNTLKDTSDVLLDWSYDPDRADDLDNENWEGVDLRAPIVDVWPKRLPLLYVSPVANTVSDGEDGWTSAGPACFVIEATGDISELEDDARGVTVQIPRKSYCAGDFALVYFNAYGGIDCLVCSGRAVRSRTYDKRTIQVAAETGGSGIAPALRSRVNYATDAVERWQLSTPFLTDAQAARMHHLLGSREVWLSLPGTTTFLPVVINDSECVDKTQEQQDGGMVAYTLNVELAEERRR